MKYQKQLDNFGNYLKINGLSNLYKPTINLFLQYLERNNIDLYQFEYNYFNQFLLELINKKLSNSYINNFIKAIRRFYLFIRDSEGFDQKQYESIFKIKLLKVEKVIKDFITEEQLNQIISNTITFGRGIKYHKLKALLYLMFYTGLRVSEVLRLERKDIDLEKDEAIIRIPNKNKQERYIYFPKKISEYLKKYFDTEPEESNAFNMNYMQIRNFLKKINGYFQDKNLSPHSLRHSFARMLVDKEIGIRVAQKLLGHKSMSSTQIYYIPDDRAVRKIYRKHVTGNISTNKEEESKEI